MVFDWISTCVSAGTRNRLCALAYALQSCVASDRTRSLWIDPNEKFGLGADAVERFVLFPSTLAGGESPFFARRATHSVGPLGLYPDSARPHECQFFLLPTTLANTLWSPFRTFDHRLWVILAPPAGPVSTMASLQEHGLNKSLMVVSGDPTDLTAIQPRFFLMITPIRDFIFMRRQYHLFGTPAASTINWQST